MDSSSSFSRRDFVKIAAAGATSALAGQAAAAAPEAAPASKMKLGFDNFSIRSLGWKAPQLLDHAASLKLDVLFISDLDSYESLEESALREVKAKADGLGIAMYVGSWSICPTSTRFRKDWGTPEEHIALGLRVAKALGSPVLRVIMGVGEDRKTPGGIEARMDDTVKVLQASRGRILDSGLKIALENHAGDMQSWELLRLIERAGPDIVGATIDSGNHAWTLEDPHSGLASARPPRHLLLPARRSGVGKRRRRRGPMDRHRRRPDRLESLPRQVAGALPHRADPDRDHLRFSKALPLPQARVLGTVPRHPRARVHAIPGPRQARHAPSRLSRLRPAWTKSRRSRNTRKSSSPARCATAKKRSASGKRLKLTASASRP